MTKELKKKKTKQAPKDLPKKQGWKVVWEIFLLLVWVGVAVVASQFIVGILIALVAGTEAFDKPVVTAVFSAVSYSLAMFLVIYVPPKLLAKWRGMGSGTISREELGLKGWPTWTDVGLAPVGFVVYLLLAAGLVALFSLFPWFDASEAQDVGFKTFIFGFDRLLAFFTLVVIAPIAEEVIFRGWLYQKIRSKLWNEVAHPAAIIITTLLVSVLFGLIHAQWNVGVNVFAMSLVLCALREITGTIYAGILLHMLKNGVAFYLLYVLGMGA